MTEEELKQHLVERHLQRERYNVLFGEGVVLFPLWNLSGQLCGVLQYNPLGDKKNSKNHPRDGKYYTSIHGGKHTKPIAVWGLETLHYRNDILVITEGVFDACRFHNEGIPTIALLSNNVKRYKSWLLSSGRKIYKAEDVSRSFLGPFPNIPCPEKDFGECTSDQVREAVMELKKPR